MRCHAIGGLSVIDRRRILFRETPLQAIRRVVCGLIWALMPARIGLIAPMLGVWFDDLLRRPRTLPDAATPPRKGGFVGMVHDLSVPTLIEAYRRGFYTCGHVGPLKWVSPPERCVLAFRDFHIGKDVRRLMRQGRYRVTFDQAFDRVIAECAKPRRNLWHVTWITPRIMHAYAALHDAGHAHSYEVWNTAGELVGGGYGVALGRVFFGESQFFRERNASKIGTTMLVWHLSRWGFALADAKSTASAMRELGFRVISRDAFQRCLAEAALGGYRPGRWVAATDTAAVAAWTPEDDLPLTGDAPTLAQADALSMDTKKPSVSVARGVISKPSADNLTARLKSIARSPITCLAISAGATTAMFE